MLRVGQVATPRQQAAPAVGYWGGTLPQGFTTMATTTTTTTTTSSSSSAKGKGSSAKGKGSKAQAAPSAAPAPASAPDASAAPATTTQPAPVATPAPTATAPSGPVVVPATAKAAALVAVRASKAGGNATPTRNQLATLQALRNAGAVDAASAVDHATLAKLTGRNKGNQCREACAAGWLVQLQGAGKHLFYATPAGLALVK